MVAPTWLGNPGLSSIQRVVWSFDRLSALKLEDSPSMISNFNGWQTSQLAASHVWSLEATVLFSFSVCMTWWTHEKFPKKGPGDALGSPDTPGEGWSERGLAGNHGGMSLGYANAHAEMGGWMDGQKMEIIYTPHYTLTHTHTLSLSLSPSHCKP